MTPTIDLLMQHCSVRRYTDQAVSDEHISAIVAAGQMAASSSFVQTTTVIRVRNPDTRAQLCEVSGGQPYVANAPALLIFCADLHRNAQCCAMHGQSMQSGFIEQLLIASVDAALVAQNSVIAAESLGLGICYIGALRNDPQRVADLLGLPEQCFAVFGLCLGYPDQETQTKPRLPHSLMLREERYDGADDPSLIADYDATMRDYYASRSSNVKLQSWSEPMSALLGQKESRPHLLAFLRQRGLATR